MALLLLAVLGLGCAPAQSSNALAASQDSLAPVRPAPPAPIDFSAERAWSNLESLVSRGPRPADSATAEAARTYLSNRLAASGLHLEEVAFEFVESGEAKRQRHATSLLARLDGSNEDLVIVAAPYTSPERAGVSIPGANEGGSGAAVALELARAIAESERSYTYLFVFIGGDGLAADPLAGSRELARELSRRGLLARARAGLFLDRVGDSDLLIVRDLYSSGPYRDVVWQSARARGHAAAFESDGFDAPLAGHRELSDAGLRQVVALIDPVHGGVVPPGANARSESDDLAHCTSESLGIVGTVALDALRTIESRLARIDRYSKKPASATRNDDRDREAASFTAPLVDGMPASTAAGESR